MIDKALLDGFTVQFDNLKIVVEQSAQRVISDPPDLLFFENQNVFIKSYLVSACSILEAFIQDLAGTCTLVLQERVNSSNIPSNFVNWLAGQDKAMLEFSTFQGSKTRKDVTDMLSPNYHKTLAAFRRIGLDISSDEVVSHKDYVSSIVEKRNKIVHHNDTASDLSFPDIVTAIDNFKLYISCLYTVIYSNPHLNH